MRGRGRSRILTAPKLAHAIEAARKAPVDRDIGNTPESASVARMFRKSCREVFLSMFRMSRQQRLSIPVTSSSYPTIPREEQSPASAIALSFDAGVGHDVVYERGLVIHHVGS